ncbi:7 transmembrane receptor [Onchocerca flexuosa]|uniref:7 transmembrane receptor n=1 Tax=Onchocerca flexuosa TaxID=387005 RepID=A0A238BZJ4_9BILA|nr:7 transmembrane receptor [Onchocerca flexuosa]
MIDIEEPPEPIASDYVELGTLIILFIIGGPLNLAAHTQITERPSATRLDILKRHLNYSDLLVLFIYVPSRICWLLTYDWRGGNCLCKIIKFLHTFAFQVSSNVIVCIAIDRLLSVMSSQHHSPEKAQRRTRIMLMIAWIAAAIISTPQFVVWKTFLAFKELNWSQCMQVWEIIRVEQAMRNSSAAVTRQLMEEENIYVIVHMMLIFWVPATIVVLCYLTVSCWVYLNSRPITNTAMYSHNLSQIAVTACENNRRRRRGQQSADWKLLKSTLKQEKDENAPSPLLRPNPRIVISEDGQAANTHPTTKRDKFAPIDYNSGGYVVNCRSSTARSRAIRISFQLVAAYIICWLPYNGLSLYQYVDPQGFFEAHVNKVYCLHSIMVFNAVINPYLYGLFGNFLPQKRTGQN